MVIFLATSPSFLENTKRSLLAESSNTFNFLEPSGFLRTARFNIKKFYMVFALLWVFCTDLRTNSDFYFIYH